MNDVTDTKKPGTFTWTLTPHKGEVMILYVPPMAIMSLTVQPAREFAQHIINFAEMAEQQMDEMQNT